MLLNITPRRMGHNTQALFGICSMKMPPLGTWVLATHVPSALVGSSQSDFMKKTKMASLAAAYVAPTTCPRCAHCSPLVSSGLTTTLHRKDRYYTLVREEEAEAASVKGLGQGHTCVKSQSEGLDRGVCPYIAHW